MNRLTDKLFTPRGAVLSLTSILWLSALCGCTTTEYVGVARAPTLPLPTAPQESKITISINDAGNVEMSKDEWRKVLENFGLLRSHIAVLRNTIEVFNRIAKSLQNRSPPDGR